MGQCLSRAGLRPEGTSHRKAGEGGDTREGRPALQVRLDQTPGLTWPRESNFICDVALRPFILSQVPSKCTLEETYPSSALRRWPSSPYSSLRNRGSSSALDPAQKPQSSPAPGSSTWGHQGHQPSPAPWLAAESKVHSQKERFKPGKKNQCPRLPRAAVPAPTQGLETSTLTCRSSPIEEQPAEPPPEMTPRWEGLDNRHHSDDLR